jgi:hypothetical protein
MKNPKTLARFYKKVSKQSTGCWEWTASRDNNGYGYFKHDGMGRAHRWSAKYIAGLDVEDKLVCHRCDNPCCVNPEHLFIGLEQDNIKDMIDKNRAWWQQSQGKRSAFTEEHKKNMSIAQTKRHKARNEI